MGSCMNLVIGIFFFSCFFTFCQILIPWVGTSISLSLSLSHSHSLSHSLSLSLSLYIYIYIYVYMCVCMCVCVIVCVSLCVCVDVRVVPNQVINKDRQLEISNSSINRCNQWQCCLVLCIEKDIKGYSSPICPSYIRASGCTILSRLTMF